MPVDARLLILQQHDMAIDALDRRSGALPEAAAGADARARIAGLRKEQDSIEATRREADRRRSRLEGEIGSTEQRISRVREKMFGGKVSNPRELSALQADEQMLVRQRSETEDTLLELMLELDELDPRLYEGAEAIAALDAEIARLAAAESAARELLVGERADEIAARAAVAAEIDTATVDEYERTRSTGGGVGAAVLVGDTCQGCHLQLSLAELHHARTEDAPRCPNCLAILVLET